MNRILILAGRALKSIVIVIGTMSVVDFAMGRTSNNKTTDSSKSD